MSTARLSSYAARRVGGLFTGSCREYATIKRPAVYLHNSVTRAELFLIGIDHVSPKSADIVKNLIKDVRPSTVAVELCEKRAKALLSAHPVSERLRLRDILKIKGNVAQKILTYVIKNMYADLACTGLKPGEELRVAIEQGNSLGASISYIDQDIDVTLERAGQGLYLKEAFRFYLERKEIVRQHQNLFQALNHEDITQCAEAMLDPKPLKEVIDLGEKYFPGLVKAILHERNEYMIKNLREMKGSIVGVVGALHVEGMHNLWREAELECSGRERFLPMI